MNNKIMKRSYLIHIVIYKEACVSTYTESYDYEYNTLVERVHQYVIV